MPQFMGDAVFLLELTLFSVGLVTLHFGQQLQAKLIRAAGLVLSAGSAATAACTGYYWLTYAWQGDFSRALLVVSSN